MRKTSIPNDLTSRLRSRLEADRRQIEETAARELKQLGENLSAAASGALCPIESDTAEATARLRAMLLKACLRPLVVGLSLFLGISGGSWVTMHWLSVSIERRIETLAALNADRARARDPGRDRGDDLGRDAAGDRREALRGAAYRHVGPSVLHRGRAALREAVGRVRELYDRVGTAVDGGLGEAVHAVRDGTAAVLRAGRSLTAACRAASRAERNLAAASRAAQRANDTLGPGLQDARRDVVRALDLTRQRDRARDHGPSR